MKLEMKVGCPHEGIAFSLERKEIMTGYRAEINPEDIMLHKEARHQGQAMCDSCM